MANTPMDATDEQIDELWDLLEPRRGHNPYATADGARRADEILSKHRMLIKHRYCVPIYEQVSDEINLDEDIERQAP